MVVYYASEKEESTKSSFLIPTRVGMCVCGRRKINEEAISEGEE